MCEEAFEETNGQCVPYQLAKHLVRKGKPAFTQEELTSRLKIVTQRLYGDEGEVEGFTTAVVTELCKEIGCPIHVLWANCKIESYTPLRPKFDRICYLIYGDHCYLVDDPGTKQHIARLRLREPIAQGEFVVAKPARPYRTSVPPATTWEEFSELKPGHFWASDLHTVRSNLHKEGVVPRVLLNGLGIPKALQYNDCAIYKRQDCMGVCDAFAQLYGKGDIVYTTQSIAGFTATVFDDMCRPQKLSLIHI